MSIHLIDGVLGCEKSTWILENDDIEKEIVLSMGRDSTNSLRARFEKKYSYRPFLKTSCVERIKTVDSFILNCVDVNGKSKKRTNQFHFDEALMTHASLVYFFGTFLVQKE